MDRAAELASALRQLAVNEDDQDLADALLEAIAKVERFADYKLRNQTQSVLGDTHVTLQERLDSLFNVARDTHQLVFGVQQEQERQGAAVHALRAEFREGMSAVGERVSDLEGRMDASEKDRKSIRRGQEGMKRAIKDLTDRLDAFIVRIDTLIEQGLSPDEARVYIAFLDELMAREGKAPHG